MPDGGNPFLFKPAVRENTPMVIALAGASGSGKTFTALELAMGLAGDGGQVAVIDTEGRRALHYADLRGPRGDQLFHFDHCELRPPFSPDRFLAAMKAAESAGYRVIVIDSFSDEHEGEGGLIDMAAAGTSQNTAANWARPKAQHKLVVRWLRQARCHVIFCLRAEERVRLEKDDKGKSVVVPIGWWPIAEKRFMYDMTASFLLSPEQPGIPQPIKLQEQHRRFFPNGQPVARDSGRQLAAWATGGAAVPRSDPGVEERAREAAEHGTAALNALWKSLSKPEKDEIASLIGYGKGNEFVPGEMTLRAREVDANRVNTAPPPDDIPPVDPNSPPGGRPGETDESAHDERPSEPHSPGADAEPASPPAPREEAFWSRPQLTVSGAGGREFQAAMHMRLREARTESEVQALRDDNGELIDGLDRATKGDVLGALMDREKELRGRQ